MDQSIRIETEMGVNELRQLHELSNLNKALNKEEYMQIVLVYQKAIDRLSKQAAQQGIQI